MMQAATHKDVLWSAAREMGSKKLIASYVFDWIIILAFAAAGGALSFVKPHHRPFSLLNQDISFPYVEESITTWMLAVVSLLAPAAIITLITLLFVPGGEVRRISTRSHVLRLKLWEWEQGLAGLALSLAVSFFVTQGMKNLFGKPRPNLLARCNPNLNDLAAAYRGGYGQDISSQWGLVDSSICNQDDDDFLQDGFRSFPSGHSSWSWAGLLYLTLFICSKFAIGLPHLPVIFTPHQEAPCRPSSEHELLPFHHHLRRAGESSSSPEPKFDNHADYDSGPAPQQLHQQETPSTNALAMRNAAATPPNYLIILALFPVAVAVYISSTRYAEFYHFGFDILFGSGIGIATAWLAFRWYHLPISRGQGWAWGARSRHRCWAIGVGTGGYVGSEGWRRGGDGEVC